MKCIKVNHIGIAVTSLKEALQFYTEGGLGLTATSFEVVDEQKAKVAFLLCGESKIELLESTSPDGPIGKYIEKNSGRGGIHHIAIEVEDIQATLVELQNHGYALIDNTPRTGAGGSKIAFVHPKSTDGCLLYT